MSEPLTLLESTRLVELEAIIAKGIQSFIEVGEALCEVRDSYKHKFKDIGYENFEDYCQKKWGMSRIHAHRLIEGAEVALSLLPTGNKPTSERQVRPLTKLTTPEAQREAFAEAVEASGGKPTAKDVEAAVERHRRPLPTVEVSSAPPESEGLFLLKRAWRRANKKERTAFIEWMNGAQD